MSLFVIVPGFGSPHKEKKLEILRTNLAILRSHPWTKLEVVVCAYDSIESTDDSIESLELQDVRWVKEKGVVGDFIRRHASPSVNADYVMILLDDVELQPDIKWSHLLQFQRQFQFDILSPTLTRKSKYQFEYMRTNPFEAHDIAVTSCCECFCLFFPKAAYQKYYALLTPNNPWLWGST